MQPLIDILYRETEPMKNEYFSLAQKFAKSHYEEMLARKGWGTKEWCHRYSIEPQIVNAGTSMQHMLFPNGFYNSKLARVHDRNLTEIRRVTGLPIDDFISSELNAAKIHYENSILKLASRVKDKGLAIDLVKATTSHIGANFNTTLTDGTKTVRAFTIIASGPVQRPHYRYLIK